MRSRAAAISLLLAARRSWRLQPVLGAEDILSAADLRQVEVGGEIGARIDATINNLLTLDMEGDFVGPFQDDSVRKGGLCCKIKAWKTTNWYPFSKHDWELTLTEFPDPDGELTYFHVPNPLDTALTGDELAMAR